MAPIYYAMAISSYWKTSIGAITREALQARFDVGDDSSLLENDVLFDKAVEWLVERDVISAISDDFGPTIFYPTDERLARLDMLAREDGTPLHKWYGIGQDARWLNGALEKVNSEFQRLGIIEEDFSSSQDRWTPLPLEREKDPELNAVINAVDKVIENIRSDNGYGVSAPEERNFVFKMLSEASQTLKAQASTTVMYVKAFIIEPLSITYQRYKGADSKAAWKSLKSMRGKIGPLCVDPKARGFK